MKSADALSMTGVIHYQRICRQFLLPLPETAPLVSATLLPPAAARLQAVQRWPEQLYMPHQQSAGCIAKSASSSTTAASLPLFNIIGRIPATNAFTDWGGVLKLCSLLPYAQ